MRDRKCRPWENMNKQGSREAQHLVGEAKGTVNLQKNGGDTHRTAPLRHPKCINEIWTLLCSAQEQGKTSLSEERFRLTFLCVHVFETGFHYVIQPGLELTR